MSTDTNTSYPMPSTQGIEVEELPVETIVIRDLERQEPDIHFRGGTRYSCLQEIYPDRTTPAPAS